MLIQEKRTSFLKETKGLKKKYEIDNIIPESIKTQNLSPPWLSLRSISIRDSIDTIGKKSDYEKEELRKITYNHIKENYPSKSWIRVYTDGSAEEATKNGGAGILIEWPNGESIEISLATGRHSDNFRAEKEALEKAANLLSAQPDSQNRQIVFLTDAKSVLQSLKKLRTFYPITQDST